VNHDKAATEATLIHGGTWSYTSDAMRTMITLALACTGFGGVESAAGDTLRCGSTLIEPGDDAAYVFEKCVEPISNSASAQSAWMGGGNDRVLYQGGFAQSQRWRIARPPGQFRAVLVIGADGRVEAIEFDTRRD
jgi:Protein of unknown function (DUF2845)